MTRWTSFISVKGLSSSDERKSWLERILMLSPGLSLSPHRGWSPTISSLLPRGAWAPRPSPRISSHVLPPFVSFFPVCYNSILPVTTMFCHWPWKGRVAGGPGFLSWFSNISWVNHFGRVTVNSNTFSFQHFSDTKLKSSELVFDYSKFSKNWNKHTKKKSK